MVAGSLLPVALHKNKLYFLFGKENPMEDSSKGWSDFGGGCEKGETPFQTALREGSEELTGFLGDKNAVASKINGAQGYYELSHNDYHTHIFLMDYDVLLPEYFNNNHHFLWNKMNKKMLNGSKLFEKIEINWFSEEDLKKRREEFRHFYREIVDKLRENIGLIKNFLKGVQRKGRRKSGGKTQRNRSKNGGKSRKYKGGCGCGAKTPIITGGK
jgi:hypothetical protein